MVEIGSCFRTKFGSIHESERDAKKVEAQEEADDFATAMCKALGISPWGDPKEIGDWIYDHRAGIKHVLETYDFIEPIPEYVPPKPKPEDDE